MQLVRGINIDKENSSKSEKWDEKQKKESQE